MHRTDSGRKRKLAYSAIAYLFSVALLLGALYWYLSASGFERENFLRGTVGVLLLAATVGYIFAGDLLSSKWEMDEKFSHLSKEILHELNLPISTIEANTKMLKKAHGDEKTQKRLTRIEAASQRLKRLYDELVYTINKEIYLVEKENFSLKETIGRRVDSFRAFDRNPFETDMEDFDLFADKIGFEQMIDNLINNAMKYSDKDSVVKIYTKGRTLVIEDRGIGINENELVNIFERYYQSDERSRGEGIGLALVKAYCDESRIGITIDSQPGRGTAVRLDLSRVAQKAARQKRTPSDRADEGLTK